MYVKSTRTVPGVSPGMVHDMRTGLLLSLFPQSVEMICCRCSGHLRWHLCRDTFHQQERWTEADLFQRSQHMLFFTRGLGSDGVGVVWNFGNALVGELLLTFLLVFSVLQTAFYSDLDFSSLVCFANWFGRVREPLLLIPIDGAPSIRPDLSFQLQHMWGFCYGPLVVAAAAAFVKKLFGASRAPFTAPFPFSVVSLSSHGIHIAQLVTQLMRRQQQQQQQQQQLNTHHTTPRHATPHTPPHPTPPPPHPHPTPPHSTTLHHTPPHSTLHTPHSTTPPSSNMTSGQGTMFMHVTFHDGFTPQQKKQLFTKSHGNRAPALYPFF